MGFSPGADACVRWVPLTLLLSFLATGCADGPLALDEVGPALEVAPLTTEDQVALPGTYAPARIGVLVRSIGSGLPVRDHPVSWALTEGTGVVEPEAARTDSLGMAWARVLLGEGLGVRLVEADVDGRRGDPARFRVEGVRAPEAGPLDPTPVRAGGTVRIPISHAGPEPADLRVLFSGIPGRIQTVEPGALEVAVPECLPTRVVELRLARKSVVGPSVPLAVTASEEGMLHLEPGEHRVFDDPLGYVCLRLPHDADARYLSVVAVASPFPGIRHGLALTGVAGEGGAPSAPYMGSGDDLQLAPAAADIDPGPRERWKRALRDEERRVLVDRAESPLVPPVRDVSAAAVPAIGETRVFQVVGAASAFSEVEARVRAIGSHVVFYEDVEAPAGGFSDEDLQAFVQEFDGPIHSTVTRVFGEPSNLNGHGRAIVLLTPRVNRLTPAGSEGFVGGFFFGLDLLPGVRGSNEAEIFYLMVPDPDGLHGDSRPTALVRSVIPSILAHEYQHMVHFNQRVLLGGALTPEALWLSEALAQTAEELLSEEHRALGDDRMAVRYAEGNWARAALYLSSPGSGALLAFRGGGTLQERGAGWLFLRYVLGQMEGGGVEERLADLTRSTRSGVTNVVELAGRQWEELYLGWAGALYLDGLGLPLDPVFRHPGISVREGLARYTGHFPLRPSIMGSRDFRARGTLPSAGNYYVQVVPAAPGGLALNLAGLDGGAVSPDSRMRLLLVRLR